MGVVGRDVQNNSLAMPLMLELKYEHFIGTWPGRIKCVELFLALFCFMCGAPGYEGPQHWFLLVAALLPWHHLLLPLLPLLSRATQQAGGQLVDGGVLVYSRSHLCLLHRLRGDARQLQRQRRP